MMKEEFEKLAGYEVSYKDYKEIIEPMYMAVDLSKQDFVKCIDRKRFALKTRTQLIAAMRKQAQKLFEACGKFTDWDAQNAFDDLLREYQNRFSFDTYEVKGYEYPGMRGCSYPKELRTPFDQEKPIQLVKI